MTEADRTAITLACQALIAALTHHGDRGHAEAAAALFAEDGVWLRGGKDVAGRQAILEELRRQPPQVARHFASSSVVTVVDADHATAITDFMFFRHQGPETQAPYPLPAPFSIGEWRDSFIRTAEGWRFARRDMARLFRGV